LGMTSRVETILQEFMFGQISLDIIPS